MIVVYFRAAYIFQINSEDANYSTLIWLPPYRIRKIGFVKNAQLLVAYTLKPDSCAVRTEKMMCFGLPAFPPSLNSGPVKMPSLPRSTQDRLKCIPSLTQLRTG